MEPFRVGQVVQMKKEHPCGANRWQITRMGMDFRIRCLQCGRSVLMPRRQFERRVKKILPEDTTGENR
jgi:hypothetical protein